MLFLSIIISLIQWVTWPESAETHKTHISPHFSAICPT